MEGLSMYLPYEKLTALMAALHQRFPHTLLLMDCYTGFGAKASRYKNPINTVGVTQTYGIDDPEALAKDAGYTCLGEHSMAPDGLIRQLKGWEQGIFRKLFAGNFARRIYRMYAFES
jgi:O-methyltransferase involved in polyketide biosynthesis